jgi:hypothetical protein
MNRPTDLAHVGKPRSLGSRSTWNVRAYDGRRPRVTFKNPARNWARDQLYVDKTSGETLETLFKQVERQVDAIEDGTANQTIGEVARRLLDIWSQGPTETDTLSNRRSLFRKWVYSDVPAAGGPPLRLAAVRCADWDVAVSKAYMDAVAATGEIGTARMEDLRTLLAAVRDRAQELGWLDHRVDPLHKVRVPVRRTAPLPQNARAGFVPEGMRPRTESVESIIRLAEEHWHPGRDAINPAQLGVGAYDGLRLSEQLGLGVEDLEVLRDDAGIATGLQITVYGVCISPRGVDPFYRPWPKNGRWRQVPSHPRFDAGLLEAARVALDLPESTTDELLLAAIGQMHDEFDSWYQLPLPLRDKVEMPTRHYLFFDPAHDQPWQQEAWNEEFRSLRRESLARSKADPTFAAWPAHIPWRNARHHAALWWRRNIPEAQVDEWLLVARWLGNSPETCRTNYVVLGDGAFERGRRDLFSMRDGEFGRLRGIDGSARSGS